MNILPKKPVIGTKILGLFVISLFLFVLTPALSHAKEAQKTSKFSFTNAFSSCANSVSGNTYCWNNDKHNTSDLQSSIEEKNYSENNSKQRSLGQRLLAVSLGIIMEVTTGHSYDDREIN